MDSGLPAWAVATSGASYLNETWSDVDGGQIRLFVPNADPVEVQPRGGTLVLFLSQDFDHEVLAATRPRWSWTGWYKHRP